MTVSQRKHLFSRAAFGISANQLESYQGLSREEVVTKIFKESGDPVLFDIDFTDFLDEVKRVGLTNKKELVNLLKKSKGKLRQLNLLWMEQLMHPNSGIGDKMVLFWANHFVCKDKNALHMQQYLNTIKRYSLGDFLDFTKAVSKQASMLKYLNGKQNRKASPNENFARELLELFTLGEGRYSELDVRESARAFTGYNHNFFGDFIFRKRIHDSGVKQVFGARGAFDGDDVIDLIVKQRQCAQFICTKIYCYFVNPQPHANRIEELTDVFYENYNVESLMRHIFLQDWFYLPENIGVKIKSPVELLASYQHIWPFEFEDSKSIIRLQSILGQSLLSPPNVAGWPGDRAWIDTNTLMMRLKLPSLIYERPLSHLAKNFHNKLRKRPFASEFESSFVAQTYFHFNESRLSQFVLNRELTSSALKKLKSTSLDQRVVQLMSLPEFQLC